MRSSANDSRPAPDIDLAAVVDACRASAEGMSELQAVYAAADAAAAEAGLRCMGGGGCCHFHLFGHRLYLTGLELARLVSTPPAGPPEPGRCPYQKGPGCSAYERRPLGCRTFFCTPDGGESARRLHESMHERVRHIHETRCIPYIYTDLCEALTQLPNG